MSEVVALLRAVNLGRSRRVGMADLRTLLEDGGYDNVRTHLQSGNVIVETTATADDVARDMERRISDHFGFDVGVATRSARSFREVVDADPFGHDAGDPSRYMVLFASKPIRKSDLTLDAEALAPERFSIRRREVYAWCAGGLQGSRLMNELSALKGSAGVVTGRNWRTVTKIAALLS